MHAFHEHWRAYDDMSAAILPGYHAAILRFAKLCVNIFVGLRCDAGLPHAMTMTCLRVDEFADDD